MLLKTTAGDCAASARRQVRPARLPAVGPADEGPEGLALRPPVIGGGDHRGHRVLEPVAVTAAEVLALLEDHHPAFGRDPRQFLQAEREAVPACARQLGKSHGVRGLDEEILLVVRVVDVDVDHHQAGRGGRAGELARIGGKMEYPRARRVLEPVGLHAFGFSALRRRMCSSRNCFSSTGDGACVSKSCARCVLGKAMTSRIDSAPAIMATMRSSPKAIPPCGGAPYCRASSRNPNLCFASSGPIDSARNTFDCTSSRWMRTEPPPISEPFSTMSYALASAAPGSRARRSSWPSLGAVNGWCIAFQRFASSSYSNIGKSTTHRGFQPACA